MGAKPQPAPEGFEVVKVGHEWIILIAPRDAQGNLTNFGFVSDPRRTDLRVPLTYRRRSTAVSDAYLQQLVAENELLRKQLASRAQGGAPGGSGARAAGAERTAASGALATASV